ERRANLAPLLGANWNVLEVGVLRAEPAGGGYILLERTVDAACLRVDQLLKGIDVGALELGVLPVLDDLGWERVQRGQFFQHLGVHAGAGLRLLDDGEFQLVKEQLAKLNPRIDIEFAACDLE